MSLFIESRTPMHLVQRMLAVSCMILLAVPALLRAADTIPIYTGTSITHCDTSTGHVLNYDDTTHAFTCDTISVSGSGTVSTGAANAVTFYPAAGTTVDDSTGITLTATRLRTRYDQVTAISANTTAGSDNVFACTAGASDKTVTLPAAASSTVGHYSLVKVDTGAGHCLFAPATGERINGVVNGTASADTQSASVDVTLVDATTPNWQAVSSVTNGARVIASGTKALATTAIASGTCAAAQTDTATGAATTDAIMVAFNADTSAVTGYTPATTGGLSIRWYPTANTVNFTVCNPTSASITPGAVSLNWKVIR